MSNIDFFHEVINDLKNNSSLFILCDGYDSWSYGHPINPICLNYDEYRFLVNFLKNKFNFDLEGCIINHSGWDCVLPDCIIKDIGKKVATFTKFPSFIKIKEEIPSEEDWENFLFKTNEEKQKSIEDKKLYFAKLK